MGAERAPGGPAQPARDLRAKRPRMARDTALILGLAPLLALQSVWVVSRAMRLPEPPGPRMGRTGQGPPMRMLVLGDSSAAGVGVGHLEHSLAPQLAQGLGARYAVDWQLCARNGATTADARTLLQATEGRAFDVAYVIFGVNDTKNLRPEAHWRRDLRAIAARLRETHRTEHIFFSGLPPIEQFPLLPNPLRGILGLRAARFDAAMQEVSTEMGCCHLPIDLPLDPAGMAADGFHPGPKIYAYWARQAAIRIAAHIESAGGVAQTGRLTDDPPTPST